LRKLKSLPEFSLRLADELVVERPGIKPCQFVGPFTRDCARRKALSSALHARNQDAFRRLEAELAALGRERALPFAHPFA